MYLYIHRLVGLVQLRWVTGFQHCPWNVVELRGEARRDCMFFFFWLAFMAGL